MSEQRTIPMLANRCAALETQLSHYMNVTALLADAAHLSPAERSTLQHLQQMIDEIA